MVDLNMIVLISIALSIGFLLHRMLKRDNINLSGPTPWPVIGNILQLNIWKPHETFDKWHKEHKGFFKMYKLNSPVVVAGTYESMHEVMVKRGSDFKGRFNFYRMHMWSGFNEWQDGIVFCPPDTTWNLLKMTSQKYIKQFQHVSIEMCHNMLDSFAANQGTPFEPRESMMNAVMNNLTTFLLGKKLEISDSYFRKFLEVERIGMELFSAGGIHSVIDLFPWLKFFGYPTFRQFQRFLEKRDALYLQLKESIAGQHSGRAEKTILNAFIELVDDGKIEGGELRIACAAMNMILPAAGATVSSFHAFVNIMTHYREVYSKLQKEVDAVIGDRQPSYDDKDNMPYMTASLFELLRYTSMFPLVPKSAVEDTQIGNVHIPKGTEILVNLWASHHDEAYWPEPFEFRPERFLTESCNVVAEDHACRRRLLPFGAGPRACIGEEFTMERLFLLMSSLIQRFEVEQPDPKVSCDPRRYSLALVLTPPDFKVKMMPRK